MTTAAYFALTLAHEMAQEVFMSATDLTADMAETGLRYAVMIDGRPAQYIAHDQEVSKGKLVTLDFALRPKTTMLIRMPFLPPRLPRRAWSRDRPCSSLCKGWPRTARRFGRGFWPGTGCG